MRRGKGEDTGRKRMYVHILLIACVSSIIYTSCKNYDENIDSARLSTSIFVASDRHENGSGNNLKGVLTSVVNDPNAVIPSLVLLGGDYVGGGDSGRNVPPEGDMPQPSDSTAMDSTEVKPDSLLGAPKQSNPEFSLKDLDAEIDSAMVGHSCPRLYTYGSHDINCTDGYSSFFSGPYEVDGYHVYGISYAQMIYDEVPDSTYDGIDVTDIHGCCAREATKYFDGWVSAITDRKPIIIMSHVPIHNQRNDNAGGERWYQSISTAAANHDILLLFCHNHTVEEHGDSTVERQKYLLIPGDTISIQGTLSGQGKNITSDEDYTHTINFYYANAGYLKLGCGSLITFRRNNPNDRYETMTIQRYSIINPTPDMLGETDKPNPYHIILSHKE